MTSPAPLRPHRHARAQTPPRPPRRWPPPLILFLALAACGPQSAPAPLPVDPQESPIHIPTPHAEAQRRAEHLRQALRQVGAETTAQAEPLRPGDQEDFDAERGFGATWRLRDLSQATAAAPPPPAQPLSDEQSQALLAQLPPLPDAAQPDFALPPSTRPAPRTGLDLATPWPPPPGPPPASVETDPTLRVLRFAPRGEVAVAAKISVTFSQPVQALGAIADHRPPALRIEPLIAGEWRWIDPYRSEFVPQLRLPHATDFTVTALPELRALSGAPLNGEDRWTFSTPPPLLVDVDGGVHSYPYYDPDTLKSYQTIDTLPVLSLLFNQMVDPQQVVALTESRARGKRHALRLATADEVRRRVAQERTPYLDEGESLDLSDLDDFDPRATSQLVYLVPTRAYPPNTPISLTLAAGLPAFEGPRRSTQSQTFLLHTYGPLHIESRHCSPWKCEESDYNAFTIDFNNPIDEDTLSAEAITVTPPLGDQHISIWGNEVNIGGVGTRDTTYRVTLPPELRDIYGQPLADKGTLTFKVTAPPTYTDPEIFPSHHDTYMIAASSSPLYTVAVRNLPAVRIRLYRVSPEDYYPTERGFAKDFFSFCPDALSATPPGVLRHEETRRLKGRNGVELVRVDLSPALDDGVGQVLVLIEGPEATCDPLPVVSSAWIQVTRLGLTAISDSEHVQVWTTHLADASAAADVTLRYDRPGEDTAVTGADGVATLPLQNRDMLVAERGADSVFLERHAWLPHSQRLREYLWHVFDDRNLYQPGEHITLKGWVRAIPIAKGADLTLPAPGQVVSYNFRDARGVELAKGSVSLNAFGALHLHLPIPPTANSGDAYIDLSFTDSDGVAARTLHRAKIEAFRRPEFTLDTQASTPTLIAGQSLEASTLASYFAGGALPHAPCEWRAWGYSASFAPPGLGALSFGDHRGHYPRWGQPRFSIGLSGRTDTNGAHAIQVDTEASGDPGPTVLTLESEVEDVNAQRWASQVSVLVHPADLYVGFKPIGWYLRAGDPLRVDAVVADLEGNLVPGTPIEMRLVRARYVRKRDQWVNQVQDAQSCTVTSTASLARCHFDLSHSGTYQLSLEITDAAGRRNRSGTHFWVFSDKDDSAYWPDHGAEGEAALSLDKDTYVPGDTARLRIQAPWDQAEALVVVQRFGVVATHHVSITHRQALLDLPIEPTYFPRVEVDVHFLNPNAAADADDVALNAKIAVPVSMEERVLTVSVTPDLTVQEPGAPAALTVQVRDQHGQPQPNVETAIFVVDEAVLALARYEVRDPMPAFYRFFIAATRQANSRHELGLFDDQLLLRAINQSMGRNPNFEDGYGFGIGMSGTGMGGGGSGSGGFGAKSTPGKMAQSAGQNPDQGPMRADFSPLALFVPDAVTDAQGRVRIDYTLPDNLTRYRLVAVAADAQRFGVAEASLTARRPLMLRPSPPRFLNQGDRFELPVVVQNLSDQAQEVQVAARLANGHCDSPGFAVTIPPNDRVELLFPAATERPGTMTLQVIATSASHRDAAQLPIPVWTPATTEAFALHGEIDQGGRSQPILAPSDAIPSHGGLTISTASTALHALTDAFIYLANYPFDCTEQLSARMLSILALWPVLDAFQAPDLPSEADLAKHLSASITELERRENRRGGLPFWQGTIDPFVTIQATWALGRAAQAGYPVSAELLTRLNAYLSDIDTHIARFEVAITAIYTAEYHPRGDRAFTLAPQTKAALQAFAAHVRTELGHDAGAAAAKALAALPLEQHSLESLGWILSALGTQPAYAHQRTDILAFLDNRLERSAGSATYVSAYAEQAHLLLHSVRRSDAVILTGLMAADPANPNIPTLVASLLAHRTKGRWGNTQENAWILLALERYFAIYEATEPDFVARMWLGDTYLGEHPYRGRTTERQHLSVPMTTVLDHAPSAPLVIDKEGPGRLYYRMALSYAPTSLTLDPLERGFTLSRSYRAVSDTDTVRRDPDGTWRIARGSMVQITVRVVVPARRYHVAVLDPLPAGLEAFNRALGGTSQAVVDPYGDSWGGRWYEHENLRDHQAEAFRTLLPAGVYEYRYLARATTPGTFVVPPAKAEEMYHPDVFGRSGSDRVIVE